MHRCYPCWRNAVPRSRAYLPCFGVRVLWSVFGQLVFSVDCESWWVCYELVVLNERASLSLSQRVLYMEDMAKRYKKVWMNHISMASRGHTSRSTRFFARWQSAPVRHFAYGWDMWNLLSDLWTCHSTALFQSLFVMLETVSFYWASICPYAHTYPFSSPQWDCCTRSRVAWDVQGISLLEVWFDISDFII